MPQSKPSSLSVWKKEFGDELIYELENTGSLKGALGNKPSIYLWKLRLEPTAAQGASSATYCAWLNDLCSMPMGRLAGKQLSHYLYLTELELRGHGLTREKLDFLQELLSSQQGRKWMTRFLADLNQHLPALYVGETQHLATRIKQHLSGDTDFGLEVKHTPSLAWRHLQLFYATLENPNEEKATTGRRTLEYLTSCLTIAGFTNRRG